MVRIIARMLNPTVCLFHGESAKFASGVFVSEDDGLAWALRHKVSGILTEYLEGIGCYDAAIDSGSFTPSKPHHGSPEHIAGFSPSRKHVHLQDGLPYFSTRSA